MPSLPFAPRPKKFSSQLDLQAMVIPAMILLFVFSYLPMWGVLMAFQDFDMFKGGFLGSPWVGLKHFSAFLTDPAFPGIMWNTLWISIQRLVFVFPAPIVLAILVNEVRSKKYKNIVQTVSYLPHFISWVIVAGFVFSFLAVDGGGLNEALVALKIVDEPINFMSKPEWFQPILIMSNIWKETGFSAIVYLAAISGIDPTLYEAAQIDGLGRFKQILHITLPMILPIVIIFLVLAIANILNAGFEDILLLTKQMNNAILRGKADVIDTYVYRIGIRSGRLSYAAAAGLFKSVISVVLLWLGNRISRATGRVSLW
jgi:putative aldouronate transport system permease protein